MLRLYSKGCAYTLRALMFAAPRGNKTCFTAKEVCQKARIPESFTRKIFQSLVQGGFLKAVPGPGGGYELKRAANKIKVYDVIRAVDGRHAFDGCILGLPKCNPKKPCPLHSIWTQTKERLISELNTKTLQNLIDVAAA